jgi:hypothetical protein
VESERLAGRFVSVVYGSGVFVGTAAIALVDAVTTLSTP